MRKPDPTIKKQFYAVTIAQDLESGVIVGEEWTLAIGDRHLLHREGGPAFISRDHRGSTLWEIWYNKAKIHRDDGPAERAWDTETGICTLETWAQNGLRHRIGAPAVIHRNPKTGSVTYTEWFENGVRVPWSARRRRIVLNAPSEAEPSSAS